MYKRGVFSLSADPITWGHLDIIRRAGALCEELVVAILENPFKKGQYLFEPKEMVEQAERCIKDFCPGVKAKVIASEESLTDLMLRENCDVVFRGARDEADRNYEEQQILYHEMILPGIKDYTVILEADPSLKHVQSTVARNFAERHLDTTELIPMYLQARLWRVMHKQKVLGVTGVPGVGKSTLIKAALDVLRAEKLPTHHLDLSVLTQELLNEDSEGVRRLKEKLEAHTDGFWPNDLRVLFFAHLSRIYRKAIKGRSGIIFVEGTYLVEDNLCHWTNNNIVVVKSTDFLPQPGSERQTGPSWGFDEKYAEAKSNSQKDRYGLVLDWENNKDGFVPGFGGVVVVKVRSGGL